MEDLALSKISDETASCQDNPMSAGEFCHNSALQVFYWSKVHGKKSIRSIRFAVAYVFSISEA